MPQHIWKLTPREAAAQCIMPRLVPNSIQESDSSKQEIMSLIAQGIGGFMKEDSPGLYRQIKLWLLKHEGAL